MQYISWFEALNEWMMDLGSIHHKLPSFDWKILLKVRITVKLSGAPMSFELQAGYPWKEHWKCYPMVPSMPIEVAKARRYFTVKVAALIRDSQGWRRVSWVDWQRGGRSVVLFFASWHLELELVKAAGTTTGCGGGGEREREKRYQEREKDS